MPPFCIAGKRHGYHWKPGCRTWEFTVLVSPPGCLSELESKLSKCRQGPRVTCGVLCGPTLNMKRVRHAKKRAGPFTRPDQEINTEEVGNTCFSHRLLKVRARLWWGRLFPKGGFEPQQHQTEWVSLVKSFAGVQQLLTHTERIPGQTLGDSQKC